MTLTSVIYACSIMIYTRRVWFSPAVSFWNAQMWLRHVPVWFQHAFLHADCDFHSQSVISTRRVWFYTQSGIYTHTSVILTRKSVIMKLTSVIHARSNVIYTRRMSFAHAVLFWPHKCDYDTYECAINIQKSDFYTQSVISTRRVWFIVAEREFYMQCYFYTYTNVIATRTIVISTRKRVISTRRVWFQHGRKKFLCIISMR
jgi:hypothetical protein